MASILEQIPGYGGYIAKRQMNQQEGLADLTANMRLQDLVMQREAHGFNMQQAQRRAAIEDRGIADQDAVRNLAAQSVTPQGQFDADGFLTKVRAVNPMMAIELEQKLRKTNALVPLGRDQRLVDPTTRQEVVGAMAKERKPMIEHNFSIGENMVQPHFSTDEGMTWAPLPGSKPSAKFARQVAPVVVGGGGGGYNSQVVQTDQGMMVFDPRTKTFQPAVAPGGGVLKPPEKSPERSQRDVPATIVKSVIGNEASLRKVNAALKLVENNKDALGAQNYLPNAITQRIDPKGVDVRAAVADIGSVLIHDRSGAVVTAAEFPRLAPFVPLATDTPATVETKLKKFKAEYEATINDMRHTYSADEGYKPLPAPLAPADSDAPSLVDQIPGAASSPVNGVPRPASLNEAMKLKPGTRFIDPSGVERVRP